MTATVDSAGMATLDYAGDFRQAAVTASLAAVAAGRGDVSLCLPSGHDAGGFRRDHCRRLQLWIGTAVGLQVGGVSVAVASLWISSPLRQHSAAIAVGAMDGFVIGLAAAVGGMLVPRLFRWVRDRSIGRHLRSVGTAQRVVDAVVAIEDGRSAARVRLVPADLGQLSVDVGRRTASIRGFSHHYTIRGCDVVRCRVVRGRFTHSVVIGCRVGGTDEELDVALVEVGVPVGLPHVAGLLERGLGIRFPLLRDAGPIA